MATWEEHEHGEVTQLIETTYHTDGPTGGQRGKGSTRIDTTLANPTAASAIMSFKHRWDFVEKAHVPLQVEVNMNTLNDNEVAQKTAGTVPCTMNLDEIDCDAGKVYEIWRHIGGAN